MQKYEKIRIGEALFLDRDGVINRRIDGGYVSTPDELELLPHATESIARLSHFFRHIFVVTNQQGIGKGLMSEDDLLAVHAKMTAAIEQAGGRLDHIYHCPALKEAHNFCRKPNIGMALQARRDHPGLRLKDCVMIGDAVTDMMFGRRCGMQTILVGEWSEIATQQPQLVDFFFPSLLEVAEAVEQQIETSQPAVNH